jgi:hypothetical protein
MPVKRPIRIGQLVMTPVVDPPVASTWFRWQFCRAAVVAAVRTGRHGLRSARVTVAQCLLRWDGLGCGRAPNAYLAIADRLPADQALGGRQGRPTDGCALPSMAPANFG